MSRLLKIPAGQTTAIREKLEKLEDDGVTWGVPDFTGATPHLTIWDDESGGTLLFAKDGTFESPTSTGVAAVYPAPGEMPAPKDPVTPTECWRQWRVTYQDGSVDYFPPEGTRNRTEIYRPLGT